MIPCVIKPNYLNAYIFDIQKFNLSKELLFEWIVILESITC